MIIRPISQEVNLGYISDTPGKPYNLENVEGQARCPASQIGELFTKKKWECKDHSASLWNKMIVISCVIAISLDPLFLYIPFIDEDNKCLGMDKKLRNVALILRSLTDITFLVDIGYQIIPGINKAYEVINQGKEQWELDWQATLIRREEIIPFAVILARELNWCSLVTDLLSVFPMPQLLVGYLFFEMRGPEYLERRKAVNFFLLNQYLPRIYRIILSSKELTRTTGIRVKAIFNLFCTFLLAMFLEPFGTFFRFNERLYVGIRLVENKRNAQSRSLGPQESKRLWSPTVGY
ncbi:cyclic nucleotide gated channel 1 [Prunus dulcis]|uniref:Cyclic nucleotide gated channel 1 n=1 Tax=Prunus dulcis TaxID=3755 RepID=A0A4Y1RAD5_PRUDU|nr:cyclic nucleotide gated channel 1 [Prunus dulcis]